MHPERFDALIARLERQARDHPAAYRWRVGIVALAGFAYLWFLGLGSIALIITLVLVVPASLWFALKFLWPLLLLPFAALRAMWVKFPRPPGRELRREDAPHLFREIEELRRALGAPRIHRVVVNSAFNASMIQRPRVSVLWWYENSLVLGLPLMAGLPRAQFRAILAHELAHASRYHGRFGSWIYRLRTTWDSVLSYVTEERHWTRVLLDVFLKHYVPYFDAYSFVLIRNHELEADRAAVELAGRDAHGQALVALEVISGLVDEVFDPLVRARAEQSPEPPTGVFHHLIGFVQARPVVEWRARLPKLLRSKTRPGDTHPALRERLAAVGYAPGEAERSLESEMKESAARYYLGAGLERLVDGLEADWRSGMAEPWRNRHEFVRRSRIVIAELSQQADSGTLREEAAWRRANLTAQVDGLVAAIPALRYLVERSPDHAAGNFMLGQALLQQGDRTGVEYLERAIQRDPSCAPQVSYLIAAFHESQGNDEQAKRFRHHGYEANKIAAAAEQERRGVDPRDRFLTPDVTSEVRAQLREKLLTVSEIQRAYLARKDVEYYPERPYYVLALVLRQPWYRLRSRARDRAVVNRVAHEVPLPGQGYIIQIYGRHAKLGRTIGRLPASEILRR